MDVIRIVGLLLVIVISITIGNLMAKGYINRVRNLLDFITILNISLTWLNPVNLQYNITFDHMAGR